MKERYKYRIHYWMNQLKHEDYVVAMKWFPARLGISPKTWESWRYIRFDSTQEIPATAFFIMACFFDIHPSELFESPLEHISIGESFTAFKESFQSKMTPQEVNEAMKKIEKQQHWKKCILSNKPIQLHENN